MASSISPSAVLDVVVDLDADEAVVFSFSVDDGVLAGVAVPLLGRARGCDCGVGRAEGVDCDAVEEAGVWGVVVCRGVVSLVDEAGGEGIFGLSFCIYDERPGVLGGGFPVGVCC